MRVDRLQPEEAKQAAAANEVPEYYADLSIFQIVLRHPTLGRSLHGVLTPLLFEGRLDTRLRELVIMRLGWATGSVYEWTQHWRIALSLGVSADDLLGLRDWRAYDGFGPAERAVLAATDETVADGVISDETWQACRDALGGDEVLMIELAAVIGTWRMVSSLLRSLDVPLEDGVEPWPPDGRSP